MATASPATREPDAALHGTGLVVLIVDDPVSRNGYAEALRKIGFAVTSAHDGAAGLDLVTGDRPKVLVLDVFLRDVDGVEICRQAREVHGDQISIVFLSSVDDLELVERCLQSGGNDVLLESDGVENFSERVLFWSRARPTHRRQRHSNRTLAAIRAAVHGRERADGNSR